MTIGCIDMESGDWIHQEELVIVGYEKKARFQFQGKA